MGALDKRMFGGVAILSALLFVVSAVLLFTNGGDVSSDSNDVALYIATVAGVLTVIYSVWFIRDRSSFVRTVSGILTAVAGVAFLAAAFTGESAGTVLAVASIIAAAAIIADMLALWVTRVYGAMYVTAVLAALVLAMGILHFINDGRIGYHVVTFVVFAVWLALSAYIVMFVKVEGGARTREIKEDSISQKKTEKPMAKNKKATKKAKKPEKKPEPKPESKEEAKAEEKPAEKAPAKSKKPEPKPVEMPKKPEKPVEPKAEEKPEPKAEVKPEKPVSSDFMSKLKSSKDANSAAREHEAGIFARPVRAEPAEEPAAVAEGPVAEGPVAEVAAKPEELVATPAEEPAEEAPVKVPAAEEPAEEIAEEAPAEKAPVEAVEAPAEEPAEEAPVEVPAEESPAEEEPEAAAEEPAEEASVEDEAVEAPAEAPAEALAEEPAAEEAPAEAQPEEPVAEALTEESPGEEPAVEAALAAEPAEEPVQEAAFTEPDWSAVSHDASQAVPEEPVADEPPEEEAGKGEDIYTDYSPEALVRRAAHNKGLRCRRGYGPHEIPVAFVNGRVAVYVTEAGEREPVDDELEAEGWKVLRYSFAQVSDGKAQGEEIAAAVKAGVRASKASSKKAKKPKS